MTSKSYLLPVAALALVAAACGGPAPTAKPSRSPSSTPATSDLTPPATGAAGVTVWVKRYGGGRQPAVAESVVMGPDGASAFVTGSNGTVTYRAGKGERLWLAATDAFVGSGGSTPPPTVAVSPNGATVFEPGPPVGPLRARTTSRSPSTPPPVHNCGSSATTVPRTAPTAPGPWR